MGNHVNGLFAIAIDTIFPLLSSSPVSFFSCAEHMRYEATEVRNPDATKRRLRELTHGFASASPVEPQVDSITSVVCKVHKNNTASKS